MTDTRQSQHTAGAMRAVPSLSCGGGFEVLDEWNNILAYCPQSRDAYIFAASPELYAALKESLTVIRQAVERVKLANQEGDPILSAWLPLAEKSSWEMALLLARVDGGAK